jgi:hypothetical protein
MVKQINIFLDDEEHEKILKAKGKMTWKEFFLELGELLEQKTNNIKKEKKK